MSDNKCRIVIVVAFFLVIIFLLTPVNAISLENALVNDENGDIVFTYRNPSSNTLTICWYDVKGNLLCNEKIIGASSGLEFVGEKLKVSISKYDTIGIFGRDGTKNIVTVTLQEGHTTKWEGWSASYGAKQYAFAKYVYEYEETPYPATLFYSEYSMKIKNVETGEVVELINKRVEFPFR